ncbi:hypothetical protein GSI_03253 [Ganoderma sinense ZZ0214-1]|uniref:Uncharacterized protein n=1 Tax=Ganoderma sinense ZZ0214-1 TaxID=1077348 RepID=A0A2G8SL26_9APHY|nr:hypothetical protein GSI_03253 [Ganoderma sinense ZZ0214-1]
MATLVINTYVEQPVVLPSPWNCTVINKPFIPPWLLSSNIAGDLLVLFVTWANTYTSYKTQRRLLGGPTLVGVMLQNALTVRFATSLLTIMNAMCIIPQTVHPTPPMPPRWPHLISSLTYLFKIVKAALFETFATVVISPLTAILTCRFLLDLHHANDAATSGPTSTPSMDLHFAGGFDLQFQGPGSSTLMAPGPSGSVSRGTTAELPAFIASTGEQVYMHLGTGQSFEFLDQDVGGGQRTDSGGGVREFELTSSRGDSGGARRADVERQGRRTHDSEDGFTVSCRLGDAGARVAA